METQRMKEVLQFISEGGAVERFHSRPGIKPNTDAQHSHGVALLCSLLVPTDEQGRPTVSAALLLAALTHDLAEQLASDVSAPAKRLLGIRQQLHDLEQSELCKYGLDYEKYLTAEEAVILSLADCFDGLLYCCRELALGNRNVLLIWRKFCSYVDVLTGDVSLDTALLANQMYESIKLIYQEVRNEAGPSFDVFK